jgi:hypothetical protein
MTTWEGGVANSKGRLGTVVDVDTGLLRKDYVLVQNTPRAILIFGFGPRAELLARFAAGDESDPDPFITHSRRVAQTDEHSKFTKLDGLDLPNSTLTIPHRSLRRLAVAEALAKAGYDPNEPRDERGRWRSENGGAIKPRPDRPTNRHEHKGSGAEDFAGRDAYTLCIERCHVLLLRPKPYR